MKANKPFLLICIIAIGILSFIHFSSAELIQFDNVKSYDVLKQEVTITNTFGLGGDIAKVKLNTPLIYYVPRGYQKIAEFEVTNYKDYVNAFEEIKFYNTRDLNKEISRTYDYKYKTYETILVNDYSYKCSDMILKNGTIENTCESIVIGNHKEQRELWLPLEKADFISGEVVTIGIFTEVLKGDNVEWIPNFYGVKINVWAVWSESLNTDLVSYYKFDETSGNIAYDSVSTNNLTRYGNLYFNGNGKIENAIFSNSSASGLQTLNVTSGILPNAYGTNYSFFGWMKTGTPTDENPYLIYMDGTNGTAIRGGHLIPSTNGFNCIYRDDGNHLNQTNKANLGLTFVNWNFYGCVKRGNILETWVNGVNVGNDAIIEGAVTTTKTNLVSLGTTNRLETGGAIDELSIYSRAVSPSEIADLYNNGTGLTYVYVGVFPPNVTLNSPENYYNSSISTITFNFTGLVYNAGEYIDSITLYVDNETSETNTTNMANGTTYIITKAISSGFHNWSVSITGANGTTTTSDLRFFNITIYSPNVTLTSPIAYYNTSNPTITFEAEATDDFGITNVSLYLDGVLNETLISSELISNGYSYQEDADSYICEGIWAGESCETIYDGLWEISTYSDTGNSTIDIIYIKPSDVGNDTKWLIADGLNQGRLNLTIPDSCWSYNSNLSFRITAHNSGDIWYQCYNGDWVTLKWSEVGMEPWEDAVWWENLTLYEFTKTLSEGEHYWSILAYDNDSNPTQSGDRYFTVDLTPPIINVTSPPSNNYRFWLNYTDNQYSTFPYSSYFINWTTIDNFAVDKCWYENISTSLVRTNITITCDENATIVYPVNTGNTLRFFANDTSGNIGSIERTNITNDIRIDRKEHSWINETTEGVSKTFFMFVRKGVEDTLENVNFVFDDVKYPLSTSGLYGWNFTKTIIIPEVTEETETTYYWEFDFGEGFFNSTIYNITIENVVLSEVCNSTYPYYVFNLTLKDEKTQNIINGTIETDISFYPFGNSSILLYEWTSSVNANNTFLCSNLPFNTTDIYKADGAIKYYSDLGTITNYTAMVEYYNFLNYTLIEYNNISLYDINSTEGTEFQLTFKDSSFQTREDILIYVYREYVPEGEFKLVELPKTDSNGQTIVHLVRNDVLYNLIAVDSNGNVLGTLNNVIAFCQDYTIGNCFINFQGTTTTEELTDFWNDVGIRYSLSFDNSTNLISLTFSSLTTDSKEVRMEVISSAIVTNRTLCNTSLTDITGTLTCDVSSIVNTTSSVNVRIFVDGVQKLQDSLSFESSSHSIDGLIFFGFLLLLAIGIFFMESKEGVIIGTIIGLISLIALGVVKGQVVKTGVTSAVIWLIVVGIVLLIKLNGERQ